jgi:general transcription factor IIIA
LHLELEGKKLSREAEKSWESELASALRISQEGKEQRATVTESSGESDEASAAVNLKTTDIIPKETVVLEMSKKRKVSLVWKYFEKKGKDTAVCRTCHKELMVKFGSTSSLSRHLLGWHKNLHFDLKEMRKAKKSKDNEVVSTSFNKKTIVSQDNVHDQPRICDKCGQSAPSMAMLTKHIKFAHENIGDLQCPERGFKTQELNSVHNHIKSMLNISGDLDVKKHFKCHICNFASVTTLSLARHIDAIHAETGKCPLCCFSSPDKSVLNQHLASIHNVLSRTSSTKDYKCTDCDYSADLKWELTRHKNTVHLNIVEKKCPYCEYFTFSRAHLEEHNKAVHLNIRDKKCTQCDYSSSWSGNLIKHVKNVHNKVHVCPKCNFSSPSKLSLSEHLSSDHAGELDHKCPHCEFSAFTKTHLKIHNKAVHLNIGNYKCTQCDYASSRSSVLKNHVKNSHGKVDLRYVKAKVSLLWDCTQCDYASSRPSHIRNHVDNVHGTEEKGNSSGSDAEKEAHTETVDIDGREQGEGEIKAGGTGSRSASQDGGARALNDIVGGDDNTRPDSGEADGSGQIEIPIQTQIDTLVETQIESVEAMMETQIYLQTETQFVEEKKRSRSRSRSQTSRRSDNLSRSCEESDPHCVNVFPSNNKSNLNGHISSDYRCSFCDFASPHKSATYKHVQAVHKTRKYHKCRGCEYSTQLKANLTNHVKSVQLSIRDPLIIEDVLPKDEDCTDALLMFTHTERSGTQTEKYTS